MIKFFRKIRQKLLSENNIKKYLLYAIGEIIFDYIIVRRFKFKHTFKRKYHGKRKRLKEGS